MNSRFQIIKNRNMKKLCWQTRLSEQKLSFRIYSVVDCHRLGWGTRRPPEAIGSVIKNNYHTNACSKKSVIPVAVTTVRTFKDQSNVMEGYSSHLKT